VEPLLQEVQPVCPNRLHRQRELVRELVLVLLVPIRRQVEPLQVVIPSFEMK